MSNKIQLNIAGYALAIVTDEDEEHVRTLAAEIEKDIIGIMDGAGRAPNGKAAVVCALDYYDKLQKANEASVNLRNQIRDYLADAANAKLIIDEREKTIAKLTRELAESTPAERAEDLSSQIAAEKEKNVLLYRELDALTEKLNLANGKLSQYEQSELPKAQERIAELERRLAEGGGSESELAELKDDLADVTDEARQLRDQNTLLQSQKEALFRRAVQAEEQAESLRSQLETLEGMIEEEGLVRPTDSGEDQADVVDVESESPDEQEDYIDREPPAYEDGESDTETDGIDRDEPQSYSVASESEIPDYIEPDVRRQTSLHTRNQGEPDAEQPDIVETLEERRPLYGLSFPDDEMPDLNWTDEVL